MVMTAARFVHYTIDIADIDGEHWSLCTMMDEAITLAKAADVAKLEKMLLSLQIVLREYFEHEEQLMEAVKYPYIEAHRREHASMQRMMDGFVTKAKDQQYRSFYFPRDLEELFIQHIDYSDRQYSQFIKEQEKSSSN